MTVKALKKNNMARTTGKPGFQMRSGNSAMPFKMIGSSPARQDEGFVYGEEKLVSDVTDPKTRVRTRKYETPGTRTTKAKSGGKEFNEAFRQATEQGLDTFTFKGKSYTTERGKDTIEKDLKTRTEIDRPKENLIEIPKRPIQPLPVGTSEKLIKPSRRMKISKGTGRVYFGISGSEDRSKVKRPKRIRFKKRILGGNCIGDLCEAVDGGIKTVMNPK